MARTAPPGGTTGPPGPGDYDPSASWGALQSLFAYDLPYRMDMISALIQQIRSIGE